MFKSFIKVLVIAFIANTALAQQQLDLGKLFAKNDDFLEVDQAFAISIDPFSDEMIVNWDIADGYYLYQHQLMVELKQATIGNVLLPEGKHKVDDYFGEVQTYEKQLQLGVPFSDASQTLLARIKYQGCAEAGLCYPPTSRYFSLEVATGSVTPIERDDFDGNSAAITSWSAPEKEAVFATTNKDETVSESPSISSPTEKQPKTNFVSQKDRIIDTLNDSTILGFFTLIALGIGLAFTPCVFPMMPIISSIIAGEGKNITTSKAFLLSVTYTQAMAIPYVALGFVVAAVGASVTATLQSAPFIISAAAVFIILAIGMFGFYEIQLPTSLQNKLNNVSQKQKGGTYIGAAIMGAISGLVVSPCVTIPLIAVLTWISQVGDPITGGIYLYGLALGMGVPLIIIGVTGGKFLPRAGAWMDVVKAVFGVLMIVVALYITKHLIPNQLNLILWGTLAITVAVYMGALHPVEKGWPRLWKGLGIVILIYGASLIIGSAMGNKSLTNPLAISSTSIANNEVAPVKKTDGGIPHEGFTLIKSSADLDRYIAQANAEGKTVMLDFFAEYCAACYEFAELTFPAPEVQAALSNTLLLQADVTAGDELDIELMERFNIFGLPAILFFDNNGQEVSSLRAEGFEDAETFAARIDAAIGE